jgi:hypothetical protein
MLVLPAVFPDVLPFQRIISMTNPITDKNSAVIFDPKAVPILQAIFEGIDQDCDGLALEEGFSKKVSVKFMITKQDEKDLRELGYSQAQIEQIKPQEASDILAAGTKAAADPPA